ncbi:hypothetical protein [Bosea sp. 2RAB26]|uniref:hypothetical protein n=1 Tax=Bosea sp. 2RAB26 TaxID=3237476 RepID=UPI003F8E371A
MVTQQAAASNFGVTVENFVAGVIARPELGLRDRGCNSAYCTMSDGAEKRWLYIKRDRKNVVTQVLFELPLPASTWSNSAEILDLIQFSLLIPPLGRIDGGEIARTAKSLSGAGISIRAPAIVCSAMVQKHKPENMLGACSPS